MTRWLEQQGFSWGYWEWNASFGIYDPKTDTYRTGLVDALLKNSIPDPFSPSYKTIYSSDFTNNSNDGWTLYNNDASAASTAIFSGDKATITFTKPGTEGWHVQLIKEGCPLEEEKTYLVSFHAFSPDSEAKRIHFNFSKASDPWTSYAGKAFMIGKGDDRYELLFTATHTDPRARMVFSMGNAGSSGVILHTIEWEEVLFTH